VELSEAEIARLRQSGIRLDAEGRFWHEGDEVTHHGLKAAFYRWLDREADGRWVLRLDERRFVYLEVEDAPFVVRSLRWQDDRAYAQLSDGSEELLDLSSVRLAKDEIAYATVKGRFPGRFTNTAWNTLGERLVERDGGLWIDGAGGPYRLATS